MILADYDYGIIIIMLNVRLILCSVKIISEAVKAHIDSIKVVLSIFERVPI